MTTHDAPQTSASSVAALFDRVDATAPLLLRLATGLLLVPHGAQKLFGWFGGRGLDGFAQYLTNSGYAAPYFFAASIALLEFFGGLMLALGLLTRPVAAAVVLFMLAAVQFHWRNGFFWPAGGVEYPLFWAIAALYFVIRGGGAYSADRRIGLPF